MYVLFKYRGFFNNIIVMRTAYPYEYVSGGSYPRMYSYNKDVTEQIRPGPPGKRPYLALGYRYGLQALQAYLYTGAHGAPALAPCDLVRADTYAPYAVRPRTM